MRVVVPAPSHDPPAIPRQPALKPGKPDLRLVGDDVAADAWPASPRLAVIVAADMVDFTRHMASDQAGTHALVRRLRRSIVEPALARHGAGIVKHTGDGFLAAFASATLAVWFAVTFQSAVRAWNARRARGRQLEFRIGVNLGDVIIEAHDLFGHSVNVASRLEALARPGGVLVSHAVFVSVRDPRLAFEDAGELSLKNVEEPVRSFHVRLPAAAVRRNGRRAVAEWGEQRDSNP